MSTSKSLIILILFFKVFQINGQSTIVGFYNCENFYDTTNQINVIDEDFLPSSLKQYNQSSYNKKSQHLARVIYKLGKLEKSDGIALFGLVEIENEAVLTKLINEPMIKKYHYKFIHFDSKDPRGVDVALIYNPTNFKLYQYRTYSLTDETHFNTYATRDILFVKGLLNGEWVYVLVNHWPSRRGGEQQSADKRNWASCICKKIMDSVHMGNPNARFIVMGDFNDNPTNKSLQQLEMINPFYKMYKKGMGTLAYNDSWNLFDQILLSKNWDDYLKEESSTKQLSNYKSIIYSNYNMTESQGRYQGYPKRTYNGNIYRGGYSDHFPVALIFRDKSGDNSQ
jgi:hypothetical protein